MNTTRLSALARRVVTALSDALLRITWRFDKAQRTAVGVGCVAAVVLAVAAPDGTVARVTWIVFAPVAAYAAWRGWLGWRFARLPTAIGLGFVVAVAGPRVMGWARHTLATGGLTTLVVEATVVTVVATVLWRQIRYRSPIAATALGVAVLMALVAPDLLAGAAGPVLGYAVPAAVLYLLWRRLRW